MQTGTAPYDPRYLAGIVLFNRGDFFEAHEVWELLWMETFSEERKFYQALIQAAVGLCHFCNGNGRGAIKLYKSSREYMHRYDAHFLGLDQTAFWSQMDQCYEELLAQADPVRACPIKEDLIPEIELSPPPESWPDPEIYLHEE